MKITIMKLKEFLRHRKQRGVDSCVSNVEALLHVAKNRKSEETVELSHPVELRKKNFFADLMHPGSFSSFLASRRAIIFDENHDIVQIFLENKHLLWIRFSTQFMHVETLNFLPISTNFYTNFSLIHLIIDRIKICILEMSLNSNYLKQIVDKEFYFCTAALKYRRIQNRKYVTSFNDL